MHRCIPFSKSIWKEVRRNLQIVVANSGELLSHLFRNTRLVRMRTWDKSLEPKMPRAGGLGRLKLRWILGFTGMGSRTKHKYEKLRSVLPRVARFFVSSALLCRCRLN